MARRSLAWRLIAAGLAAAPSGHAWARDVPANGEIVVTGRGLADTPSVSAYRTSELDRREIVSSASGLLDDVLSGVAGFEQYRRSDSRSANPSAQGVTLRGIGGNATSRALVLLDGVPMADPFFGSIPFGALSPERIGAIRVTHGGGAGAFGAGAVSGTVELSSASPAQTGPYAASIYANDRAETQLSGLVAPRLGSGFATLSGRWDRGEGFQTTPPDQRVPASARAAFDRWSTGLRAVAPVGASGELQFGALVFDDHRTLRFTGANSRSRGQDASVRLVLRGPWQLDAIAYVQARDFSNVVISSSKYVEVLNQRATPSTGLGGKLELRPPVGAAHVLRLGADLRVAEGHADEEAFSAATGARYAIRSSGGRNADFGLFAEDDWTLGPVVLTAGVRADRWSIRKGYFETSDGAGANPVRQDYPARSGWQTSLRGGAVWRAGGGLSLRAAAYTSLRQPTLNELYRSYTVYPVTTQANPDLRNERLEGYEAGLDYARGDTLSFSLTAFDNRLKNAIANVSLTDTLNQRRNVDAIRARGIELAAAARVGAFTLNGSLAWTRARVEASGAAAKLNGMRPAQVPALAASATLAWQPRKGWRLSATMRRTGNQFEDDRQTYVLPAATTFDAYAEMPLPRGFALVLRAENLTDARVETRNLAGSIDLGAPRTIWIGVKLH